MADRFTTCVAEYVDYETGRDVELIWFRTTVREISSNTSWTKVWKMHDAVAQRNLSMFCVWFDGPDKDQAVNYFATCTDHLYNLRPLQPWQIAHPDNGFMANTDCDIDEFLLASPYPRGVKKDRPEIQFEYMEM